MRVFAFPPRLLIAKGLLDKVLDTGDDGAEHQWRCNDYDAVRARAKAADEALSEDAFKTIAVGVRYNDGPMRFAGIVPMRDPPRHDTGETIAKIRASGVGVKMITGDHLNIAKKTAARHVLRALMHKGTPAELASFIPRARRADAGAQLLAEAEALLAELQER